MLKKLILITLFVVPSMAFAGFNLSPSFGIYKTNTENTASQLNLRMGYTFDFGLFVGGFYTLSANKFIDDSDEYLLGPMIGYEWKGLYGQVGYIVNSDSDMKSGGIKYSSGTGYTATVGYRLAIAEDTMIGPEVTYRTTEYDSVETQGIGVPTDRTDTVIIPGIALLFNF